MNLSNVNFAVSSYPRIHRLFTLSILVLSLITQGMAFSRVSLKQSPSHSPTPAVTSDDIVREWNEIALRRILPNGPPFTAARFMTMTQLAVFEAVNAITGKYQPYLGTVSAPDGASPEAAAVMASYGVLAAFFPGADLDQRKNDSLATIPDGQSKTDGIAVGQTAAAAIIADRTGDGDLRSARGARHRRPSGRCDQRRSGRP